MSPARQRISVTTAIAILSFAGGLLVSTVRATVAARSYAMDMIQTAADAAVKRQAEPLATALDAHLADVAREKPHMERVARQLTGAIEALCEATPKATAKCLRALAEPGPLP